MPRLKNKVTKKVIKLRRKKPKSKYGKRAMALKKPKSLKT